LQEIDQVFDGALTHCRGSLKFCGCSRILQEVNQVFDGALTFCRSSHKFCGCSHTLQEVNQVFEGAPTLCRSSHKFCGCSRTLQEFKQIFEVTPTLLQGLGQVFIAVLDTHSRQLKPYKLQFALLPASGDPCLRRGDAELTNPISLS
jgi:hypothetical protein